jgi:ferredoxin--NADP+ reductase
MYRVLKRELIVPNIHLLVIESEFIHKNALAGEFVVVRADEKGERIPLNLVDWDSRSVSMVFMALGTSTYKLAALKVGDEIATLAGPLGKPTEKVQGKNIICIGGCYGIGALYPVIRMFKENQNHITTIDMVYVQGCTYLTYLVSQTTRPFNVKTIVGLNPIMVDATGMCGVCRVIVGGETKFGCVDGPEFDGHQVDWDTLLARRRVYLDKERYSLSFYECERYG